MIFALLDYYRYVNRSGRFAYDIKKSVMGGAFQAEVPIKAIKLMEPGDLFLVQTMNSWISWVVMYLTTSEISHVATYAGEGKIIHATFDGLKFDSVESLFTPDSRVLPAKMGFTNEERAGIIKWGESNLGMPYGWFIVFRKGAMILSGRDWEYFRWQFAADISLTALALDLPIISLFGIPLFTWIVPIYFAVVAFNWLLCKVKPLTFNDLTGKPCDMLMLVKESGGSFVFDAYNLHKQLHRDSMPLSKVKQ